MSRLKAKTVLFFCMAIIILFLGQHTQWLAPANSESNWVQDAGSNYNTSVAENFALVVTTL